MKRIINIILLVLLSTPVFSQGFNDSIMNATLFQEITDYTSKRSNTFNLLFTQIGSDLYCDGGIDYMVTNGVHHRSSYIEIVPDSNKNLILNEVGIEDVDKYGMSKIEILARVFINNKTTYNQVAKQSLNAWLSKGTHSGVVDNIENKGIVIYGISSSYNQKTNSVDIVLTSFNITEL